MTASPHLQNLPVPYRHVAVLGGGAWGTALAALARKAGSEVRLWARDAQVAEAINARGLNPVYLPDVALPAGIMATTDMSAAVDHADVVLMVVPSAAVRATGAALQNCLKTAAPVVLCAKGIEQGSGYLMSQVAEDELPARPIGVLSGPTFAREAVLGHPTAATVAFPFARDDRLHPECSPATRVSMSLSSATFRTHITDDVVGAEICGAVKNVIAVACGMMSGAGYAENTRAALITLGLTEMRALVAAMGGRDETVMGLAGLGDLSLTCASTTSRNMALGYQLGQGVARADCFDGQPVVVEGEKTAINVCDLAARLGVEMPVAQTVRAILHQGADLRQGFADLWARPLWAEPDAMRLNVLHPAAQRRR